MKKHTIIFLPGKITEEGLLFVVDKGGNLPKVNLDEVPKKTDDKYFMSTWNELFAERFGGKLNPNMVSCANLGLYPLYDGKTTPFVSLVSIISPNIHPEDESVKEIKKTVMNCFALQTGAQLIQSSLNSLQQLEE